MTYLFNKQSLSDLRKKLRANMTRAEVMFWQAVRNKQLDGIKFRRQHGIANYIVDFYVAKLKLVIEIDGDSHAPPKAQVNDANKQALFESLGIKLIRFRNDEIYYNLPGVLNRLRQIIGPPLL